MVMWPSAVVSGPTLPLLEPVPSVFSITEPLPGRGPAANRSSGGFLTARPWQTRYAASTSPVLSFEEMSPQAPETLCTSE